MTRLRRAEHFFTPSQGLYVAIPPEYGAWGVVPGIDFIDQMMKSMKRQYYVAMLSAAQLYGVTHQHPQVFQVMTDRYVENRHIGRVRLKFYTRRNVAAIPTLLKNSATGQFRVSTPASTCFDLVSRPNDAGGISNVATVLGEFVEEDVASSREFVETASHFPVSCIRRLGWLLESIEVDIDTDLLKSALMRYPHRGTDLLDPAGPRRGSVDSRWGLVINTTVEPDL